MKRAIVAVVVFMLLLPGMADAKYVFGLRPNTISPQAAYFGFFASPRLLLTGGLQFLSVGLKQSGEVYDEWEDDYVEGSTETSMTLWTPSVGLKYFLRTPAEDTVVPYFTGTLFTVIPSSDIDRDVDEVVDDIWSVGLSAAFGAEFFFHRDFSLGGEFGMNFLYAKYDEHGMKITGDIEATYAALTLNFHL